MTDIEAIERLVIKPGEMLVLHLLESMDEQDAQELADRARQCVPDGIPVMVLHGDIKLTVAAKEGQ